MDINVILAFSNLLFSEGVKRLLESENGPGDIKVAGILSIGDEPRKIIGALKPDVVLVDLTTLYNVFGDLGHEEGLNLILLDTGCGSDNIISAIVKKGLKGVVMASSTLALLKKAIRTVAKGDIWLDKTNIKNLLSGVNSSKMKSTTVLSERELEIVSLVGQGYRNKEIAKRLYVSEPTVKTHLHNIFQKLEIQNRPQLITFAIRNQDSFNMDSAAPPKAFSLPGL